MGNRPLNQFHDAQYDARRQHTRVYGDNWPRFFSDHSLVTRASRHTQHTVAHFLCDGEADDTPCDGDGGLRHPDRLSPGPADPSQPIFIRGFQSSSLLQVFKSSIYPTSALNIYCRSNFPDEFGSCQVNEHCGQPTAPYCSAFGYCTQVSNRFMI